MEIETAGDGMGNDPNLAIRETAPVVATEETITETIDRPVSQEPDVVTDDVLAPHDENEVETADEKEGAKADEKVDDKPKDGKSRTRFLEDGKYEVKRPDGTTITLDEDEVRRIARRRSDRLYKTAAAEQRRADALEAELAQLKQGPTGPSAEELASKPWIAKDSAAPKIEDFEDANAWADARDEWRAAQSAPEQPSVPAPVQALQTGVVRMEQDGMERYPDFKQVVYENQALPFHPTMVAFLLDQADDHAATFYHLAKNPDTLNQIHEALVAGDVRKASKVLARAEAQIDPDDVDHGVDDDDDAPGRTAGESARGRTAPAPAVGPSTQVSRAPAPIKPVAGGSAPRGFNAETASYEEYAANRRKQSGR